MFAPLEGNGRCIAPTDQLRRPEV
uniref:Uncharacterized protein n=1 Tax=Anguilla anguilla TaxID=7936 RepID=A0A0E9V998_ANGAN